RFVSMPNKEIPKIQWVTHGVNVHLLLPDATDSPTPETRRGLGEPLVATLKVYDVVQFGRVGFAGIDHVSKAEVRADFPHRRAAAGLAQTRARARGRRARRHPRRSPDTAAPTPIVQRDHRRLRHPG